MKNKYDQLFEILANAEMQMRNGNWFGVANDCERAKQLALKFANEETDEKKGVKE